MGTTAQKIQYLDGTKTLLKDTINLTGANITNDTFRSYAQKLKLGLINALNDNGETIFNNLEKVSGKGSNLSLTPTYEAPIGLKGLYGNTSQSGTPTPSSPIPIESVTGLQNVEICGKNLLPNNVTSQTINNIQFVKNDDGSITMNGTSNAIADLYFLGTSSQYEPLNLETGTYNLSGCNNGALNTYMIYMVLNRNGTLSYYQSISSSGLNISIQKGDTFRIFIRVLSGQSVSNITIKPMLELGSTATTYEPYKSNTYEVNLGKNLLPNTNTTQVLNNITFTKNDDDSFKMNGTANANTSYRINTLGNELSLPAGTYTISTGNNLTSGITLQGWHSTATNFVTIQSSSNKASFTLTSDVSNVRFQIVIANGTQISNLTIYPMLEKGSQATSYSPYFTPIELNKIGDYEDSIKKSTGKNLFDKDNANVINAYINGSDGVITSDSPSRTIYISCKPNTTYTISKIVSSRFRVSYSSSTPAIGTTTSGIVSYYTNTTITITTGANANYLVVWLYNSNSDTSITLQQVLDSLMIEQNSQATSYEPYGKVWYITENIGNVVLDGSETWTRLGTGTTPYKYYTNKSEFVGLPTTTVSLSTHFVYDGVKSSSELYRIFYFNMSSGQTTANGNITFTTSDITSKDNFVTWLTSNNVKVLYTLKTPIYEVITNTTLIEQLETLSKAKSKNGTTNITITSQDLAMLMDVSVIKGDA